MIDLGRRRVLRGALSTVAVASAVPLAGCGGASAETAKASVAEAAAPPAPAPAPTEIVAAAPAPAVEVAAAAPPPATPVDSTIPQIANAVVWQRSDMADRVFPKSIFNGAPYAANKHTRWERRTVDGKWYVAGGDYGDEHYGSGSNILWAVTPGIPLSFTMLRSYIPAAGDPILGHMDEAPWMYDSRRDRFLAYPNSRWTQRETADVIIGHLMYYHPSTNKWQDLGSGDKPGFPANFDARLNPQLDPNGNQYPVDAAKWGRYDYATDKYYIGLAYTKLLVLDASTLAMDWPIRNEAEAYPYTQQNTMWYQGTGCYDRLRRRFIQLKYPANGYPKDTDLDPNAYRVQCCDIDTGRFYFLETTNLPCTLDNPVALDTMALVHDEQLDQYVLFGGGTEYHKNMLDVRANDTLIALPATGGTWKQWLPKGAAPDPRAGQQMHWDPVLGRFFEFGGITDTGKPLRPEVYFPTWDKSVVADWPAWRRGMVPNTWRTIAAARTMAAIDPARDRSLNPNFPDGAPWGYSNGPIVSAWGGACADDTRRTMYVYGGGHGDSGENSVYALNYGDGAPAFRLLKKPSGAIGSGTLKLDDGNENSGLYADGSPRSTHTYNTLVAVPKLGPVIARLCASYKNAAVVNKAFSFDPTTGVPSLVADYSGSPGISVWSNVAAACYDKSRYCIWIMPTGAGQLQELNLATGKATPRGPFETHASGVNALVYLPEVDSLLAIEGKGKVELWNLQTYTKTALRLTGSFASGFGSLDGTNTWNAGQLANDCGIVGMAWDEVRHRLVMWSNTTNRTQLSTLTPGANFYTDPWTCGAIDVAGANTVTPTAPARNGTFGRFFMSSSLDGVFLLNAVDEPVHFYAFS